MAHVFCRRDAASSWDAVRLDNEGLHLGPPPRLLGADAASRAGKGDVIVVAVEDSWALLAGAARRVHVNGLPLDAGIRVLLDRDEVRLDGETTLFFSTESLAEVTGYHGPESACMRCKLPLDENSPAVRCPSCAIWHHEDAEERRRCWTGFAGCAHCGAATAMDAGFTFRPEDL